ncbi:MAG: hypothetical protein CVT62_05810 [Actinobacteria bacterium HGW-Actinobacteria-2]|nr:MAG: hypothetical protein CVT62_05810 [Actinobacteria bacterium HGW-Actinobacteria-2]
MQLVAVLASSAASGRIRFRIDLPTGAHLSAKPDGSIAIIAPVRATVAKPGELARFEKDVRRIIGSATELGELSVDKRHAVAMVTPPATERRVVALEVGVIGVPWALDANGDPIATHYEVKGDILEQVVEVEARTKYPVTADPSISVGFFETSVSFSKSEVKSLASKSSYYSIGAAACGVIPNAIVAVACGVYAAVVLTNIGNVISKAASKKQCARINFYWIPAINFPTYKSTTRYAC